MTLVVAALLVVGALVFTLFVRQSDVPEPLPVSPIQHLEDRKRAIYDNLRDLQFEYRLGKLSDEDYQQTKQALQKELAGVLAETEELTTRLGLKTVKVSRSKEKPVSAEVPRQQAGSACPHCGAHFPQNLKYCGECGKAMA
jgi:DNA repair exonuclease SbcCD ATPase subunit